MQEINIPKYLVVKNKIIENINNEVFKVEEIIPSERALIEIYDVSRITIRKALSELEREGYLYKIHGKGTFVKGSQRVQNLYALTSCTQDIKSLGMTPSRKVIVSNVIESDKKRQHLLDLKNKDEVFQLSRVYYGDNESVNFTKTYVVYKYFPGIDNYDFSKLSLYKVMEEKYNVKITRALRTIDAVIAHDKISELLNIEEGIPLLLFNCTTYGEVEGKEVPIEVFKCYYRSDKFTFTINQIR